MRPNTLIVTGMTFPMARLFFKACDLFPQRLIDTKGHNFKEINFKEDNIRHQHYHTEVACLVSLKCKMKAINFFSSLTHI